MDPIPSPDNPAAASSAYRPDIPRVAMRVAAFIVRRMALDMREIEGEWGYVEPWHLHERGWSPHQVAMYGQLARDEIRKTRTIRKLMIAGRIRYLFSDVAQERLTFTRTERTLAAFTIIGALALIAAGALEIARPGTLPAFNAAAVQPAPQAAAFPVCRPEGA
jgi:hypothetical protein